ncbi:MAG TPA: hypothetical protein VLB27_05755, partial [candidate division Zixibacteria bacterium]|nr:hypothetical protein [candidate division Zixibacteria bacterium]
LIGDVDLGDDEAVRPQVYPPGWCCLNLPLQDSCFETNVNPPQFIPCFDFDGRVLLWTYGLTGGEPPEPFPGIAFLNPRNNNKLYESTDIWIAETAGSTIIDSAVFYYKGGGPWTRIGVDGDPTLATGFFLPGPGDGLSYSWDFSALAEGNYWLRADVHDTLGRVARDSIQVFLEPTPPVPALRPPTMYFDRFCAPLNLIYDYPDENPTFTVFQKKTANINYSKALQTLSQFALGDADGDSADGNLALNGEFGDFYGSAVAATLCMRYWHGLGYVSSMRIGSKDLTNIEAAERLAGFMHIKQDTAITDERTVLGLREYFQLTGFGQLSARLQRNPSYADLRTQFEEVGSAAMIAVAGKSGRWYAVNGFTGRPSTDGTLKVKVVDPWDGVAKTLFWRETGPVAEVYVNNAWKAVDLMVLIEPSGWQPTGRSG